VVVDANGIVTMISEEYAEFNGTTVADAVGEARDRGGREQRMHVVGRRASPRSASGRRSTAGALIVNRIPLKDGDGSSARTGGWSSRRGAAPGAGVEDELSSRR